MSVVVVDELSELMKYIPEWQDLAEESVEPNSFYEPGFLIPAVTLLGGDQKLEFILIFARDPGNSSTPPLLCGFFPLERRRRYKGFPFPVLRLWKYVHCSVCTPLLRNEYEKQCLVTFFEWLAGPLGSVLVELNFITEDGPFHYSLIDYCNETLKLSCVNERFTRAFLRADSDPEEYLRTVLSTKHRKALKRQEARLAESGKLEYVELGPDDNVESWIEEFLELEASGWKGREGSALACSEADRRFFAMGAREAFRRGRLMMVAARLNGKAIAVRCNLVAAPGSFTFKTAFDESYARFSPGTLLEIESIRLLEAHPEIRWVDSCAHSDNVLYNRLCTDRRMISSVLIGTGKRPGDLIVSVLPVLRWLRRKVAFRNASRPQIALVLFLLPSFVIC
jgi:hypothetical protein